MVNASILALKRDVFRGIPLVLVIMGFIFIPMQIFRVFFVMGLKGEPVASTIVLGLLGELGHFFIKKTQKTKIIIYFLILCSAAILCIFTGVLALFTFDNSNTPTMVVLTSVLIMGYYCYIFDLNIFNRNPFVSSDDKEMSWIYKLMCILVLLFIIYLMVSLQPFLFSLTFYLEDPNTGKDAIFFISLGIIYFIIAGVRFFYLREDLGFNTLDLTKIDLENQKYINKILRRKPFSLLMSMIVFTLLSSLSIYVVLIKRSEYSDLFLLSVIIGVCIGVVFMKMLPSLEIVNLIFTVLIGFLYYYIANMVNIEADPFSPFLLGFLIGYNIIYLENEFQLKISFSGNKVVIHCFLLLVFCGVSGFLAGQLRWLFRDEPQLIFPSIIAVISILFIFAITQILSFDLKFKGLFEKFASKMAVSDRLLQNLSESKKSFIALFLILIIATPSLFGFLLMESRMFVIYNLPETMYTVDGTPVSQVRLPARSGIILLKTNPKLAGNFPHSSSPSDYIRINKTVRLGAYFYGGTDNITPNEAIDWISKNIDVLSLGGWPAYFITPQNISYIRSLNPNFRYYIMTFSTSFYGGPENMDCTNLTYPMIWGCYFNETMHEWTLKYKNGSEAYGVRRSYGDQYGHLMDLGSEGWAKFYAWFYEKQAIDNNADGVAIDEIMWRGYWGTQVSQLRDYNSVEEITESCYKWLKIVDENMNVEIITQAFWPEAQQYQQGVWGELAFRAGGAYGGRVDDRQQNVFYETMNWEQIVENIRVIGQANKSYIWAAWYERDNKEALEYSVATYLMGKPNNCPWIGFHPQPVYDGGYPANLAGYDFSTVREEVRKHPEFFDLELGLAQDEMYKVSGSNGQLWRRDFQNGIVLVNPYHAQIPGFQNNDPVFAPSH
jgi:hypothetical protein